MRLCANSLLLYSLPLDLVFSGAIVHLGMVTGRVVVAAVWAVAVAGVLGFDSWALGNYEAL